MAVWYYTWDQQNRNEYWHQLAPGAIFGTRGFSLCGEDLDLNAASVNGAAPAPACPACTGTKKGQGV